MVGKQKLIAAVAILSTICVSACATRIGRPDPDALASYDFGAAQEVKLCVYLDNGVTREQAENLLASWEQDAQQYALNVTPVSFEPMHSSGFLYRDIMHDVDRIPLKAPCDRVLYFANRTIKDFFYGLAAEGTGMPEVLGYVDPYTLTHGFVYAAIATPSQLMNPPFSATRHELYHLLGCGQHHDMNRCYEQISMLKQAAAHSGGFFPTFDNGSPILLTSRTQVNDRLNAATEPQYVVPAFAAGNVLNLWAAPHL